MRQRHLGITERHRQISKWGDRDHNHDKYIRIMGEEFGEACEAIEDASTSNHVNETIQHLEHLKTELIQVAAVAVRFIQNVDRELADQYAARN